MSASGPGCETVGRKLLCQSGQDSHPGSGTTTSGGADAIREGKTQKLVLFFILQVIVGRLNLTCKLSLEMEKWVCICHFLVHDSVFIFTRMFRE